MAAPKARGIAGTGDPERPRTAVKRSEQPEEDFDDADVEDLLP